MTIASRTRRFSHDLLASAYVRLGTAALIGSVGIIGCDVLVGVDKPLPRGNDPSLASPEGAESPDASVINAIPPDAPSDVSVDTRGVADSEADRRDGAASDTLPSQDGEPPAPQDPFAPPPNVVAAVGFLTGRTSIVQPTNPKDTTHANERTAAADISCSAVLVAPRTVFTSKKCIVKPTTGLRFALNPTGNPRANPEKTQVYAIEEPVRFPESFDIAVIHLTVQPGQPAPSAIASPIPIAAGDGSIKSPYGIYARGLSKSPFASTPQTAPRIVGWIGSSQAARQTETVSGTQWTDAHRVTFSSRAAATTTAFSTSALGSPALQLISGTWSVLGLLDHAEQSYLTFVTTIGTVTGQALKSLIVSGWPEGMLWYYDDAVFPNLLPPQVPGAYKWERVDLLAGENILSNMLEVGYYVDGAAKVPIGICISLVEGAALVGNAYAADSCAFTHASAYDWSGTFKVLTVQGTPSWTKIADGKVPAGSFIASYRNGAPLYACRAAYPDSNGKTVVFPGYVTNGRCLMSCYDCQGGQVSRDEFEVLRIQ